MSKKYGGLAREQGATRRVHYEAANDNQPTGGVRRPANDNVLPAVVDAIEQSALERLFNKYGRAASRVALPLRYLDLAESIWETAYVKSHSRFVPGAEVAKYFEFKCSNPNVAVTHWVFLNGIPAPLCGVSGQALGNGEPLSVLLQENPGSSFSGNLALLITRRYEVAPGQYRHQIGEQWQRSGAGAWAGGKLFIEAPFRAVPSMFPSLNPNVMRGLPSQPLVTTPVPDAAPTTSVPSAQIWSSNAPRVRLGVSPRRPADHGTKERKALSKGQALAIALFRALDQTSEAAEIVDAFFEALPKDVQKRWSRNRPNRQFIDTAGQYGIDGADWKMQALYYNWDKVDLDQAVKNVIWNHYEDKLYGAIHRNLPRNTINALAPGERAIAKALSELRDWLEW